MLKRMDSSLPRIFREVAAGEVCCGCGVCAGVCPHNALSMEFNQYGEYNPVLKEEACVHCGLCDSVCPFLSGNPNEDAIGSDLYAGVTGIQHSPETGYYLDSYAGQAPDKRMHRHGASGGMVTWTLCQLLERGAIDHVITVSPNPDPEKLFKFTVVSTAEEIRQCSKSAYYPVEVSEVLRHVQKHNGRYAMVGLPCVCKAVRLAQQKNNRLKERIVVLLGLVCGQQKSKYYTKHIVELAGCRSKPKNVCFRNKDPELPASNYVFTARDSSGKTYRRNWLDGVSKIWCEGLYNLPSCFCCDDIFAECADAAFMDAWLPEYAFKPEGTSLVLVRTKKSRHIFKDPRNQFRKINIQHIVNSQGGVVARKRGRPFLLNKSARKITHRAFQYKPSKMKKFDILSSCWVAMSFRKKDESHIGTITFFMSRLIRFFFKGVRHLQK